MAGMTRERVIEVAKEIGARHGGELSAQQLAEEGGVTDGMIRRLFPRGSFKKVRRQAGLRRVRSQRWIPPEEALAEYDRVAREVGGAPSLGVFSARGRFGARVLMQRFGNKGGLMAAYRRWLKARGLRLPRRREGSKGAVVDERGRAERPRMRRNQTKYGGLLGFRGMLHEPTNEAGVVFVFGAAAEELGFVIDAFRPCYPDCEGKRLSREGGPWRRVLIEFEYRSGNFRVHGHDARGCDLVVCWEHDWPECPVPVLELRSAVAGLVRRAA